MKVEIQIRDIPLQPPRPGPTTHPRWKSRRRRPSLKPGGVGPMTIAMLMKNTLQAARHLG